MSELGSNPLLDAIGKVRTGEGKYRFITVNRAISDDCSYGNFSAFDSPIHWSSALAISWFENEVESAGQGG
jgi:hypothetical protein